MTTFEFFQSEANITAHSGLSLVGLAIEKQTSLRTHVNRSIPLRHGIQHSNVLKSYIGLLCLGKNDFEAVNTVDCEDFFKASLCLDEIPSEATLRQRMNKNADGFSSCIDKANIDFLTNSEVDLKPLSSGHVALDADATLFDNSGTKKEGVSRSFSGGEGYFPMIGYLGSEGYCLEIELRSGKQHTQKGTPDFLRRITKKAMQVTGQPLLLRLDGGHDSLENIDIALDHNINHPRQRLDFIIKWNPRRQDKEEWLKYAKKHGDWHHEKEGTQYAYFSVYETRLWKGYEYTLRRVMKIREKTIDDDGQYLLESKVSLDGWWTSLEQSEQDIVKLYADRGLSEQYHSELKTDLDIERLPSGKFSTNQLVLHCSTLAYNILRWIGQNGLLGKRSPKRHSAKRRRIKTVIQELMYVAARLVQSGRKMKLVFCRDNASWLIMEMLYRKIGMT